MVDTLLASQSAYSRGGGCNEGAVGVARPTGGEAVCVGTVFRFIGFAGVAGARLGVGDALETGAGDEELPDAGGTEGVRSKESSLDAADGGARDSAAGCKPC